MSVTILIALTPIRGGSLTPRQWIHRPLEGLPLKDLGNQLKKNQMAQLTAEVPIMSHLPLRMWKRGLMRQRKKRISS